MTDTFVVNTSPLILLARAEHLHLLKALAGTVLAPKAVLQELQAGRHYDPTAERIENFDIQLLDDIAVPLEIARRRLGPGETQVLAHASKLPNPIAVLDDRAARQFALSRGIAITGTLGIVLKSRQQKLIPSARDLVHRLEECGMRLSVPFREAALSRVGE